jgi:hypothetical protein
LVCLARQGVAQAGLELLSAGITGVYHMPCLDPSSHSSAQFSFGDQSKFDGSCLAIVLPLACAEKPCKASVWPRYFSSGHLGTVLRWRAGVRR